MRGRPGAVALALMAFFDPGADESDRFEGALVLAGLVEDIHLLRRGMVEVK